MSDGIGDLGEKLVAHWLVGQGWLILAQNWRSRWGEIDLITKLPAIANPGSRMGSNAISCVAFVEVKTRSQGNWDQDGLLAITAQKQTKLFKTAQLYLMQHPQLADAPCRFDVALVHACKIVVPRQSGTYQQLLLPNGLEQTKAPQLGQPVYMEDYRLTLQTYLESAFTV
jgi:putative endonuclease